MTTNFTLPRPLRRTGSLVSTRTVRIVVLGQAAVGKTALTVRFITKRFIGEYDPTLETIYRHELSIGGDVVHFEILDTAGQVPRHIVWYRTLVKIICVGKRCIDIAQEEDSFLIEEKIKWGDGFIIVYSVTDRCSFNEVMRLCFLVNHVHSAARKSAAELPPIFIVANKKDLEFDRMVTTEDGENLSKGLKLCFHEISAREGRDESAEVFHALYREVVQLFSSSPTSFRRRTISKVMEKIPRIHSTSNVCPTSTLSSSTMYSTTMPGSSPVSPTPELGSTSTLGSSTTALFGPASVLNSCSMLGPTYMQGPSGRSFNSSRGFSQD